MIVRVMRANGRWSVETNSATIDPRLRVLNDEDTSLDALFARLSASVPQLLGSDETSTQLHMVAFESPA